MVKAWRYPLYVIANSEGVLVAKDNDRDCILLFHDRALAAIHIAQLRAAGSKMDLHPLAIPDADAFRTGLNSLPADITCAVWDATLTPCEFVHMGIDDLLKSLG